MKSLLVMLLIPFWVGCGIYSYPTTSFNSTYSIEITRIKNDIRTHSSSIDYEITKKLEDRVNEHPNLNLTNKDGDYHLSGSITNYTIKAFSIGANEEVYLNRVTLQLSLKLLNQLESNKVTQRKITVFTDYNAKRNFGIVKDSINTILAKKASEEAFSDFFLSW